MVREDPSLVVEVDEESGQTVLKGIGELHLEVCTFVCDHFLAGEGQSRKMCGRSGPLVRPGASLGKDNALFVAAADEAGVLGPAPA